MKIGVITDTHGHIHPGIFDLFDEVEVIFHAGDIDSEEILTELETIAPVHAVYGNVDPYELQKKLPVKRILKFEGVTFLLIHQALSGEEIYPEVSKIIQLQKIDMVIFGHTHIPFQKEIEGVLFFNPGVAGKRRFHHPLGAGIIEINNRKVQSRIEILD